ncbi:M28 family peptidase [Limnovirga soli]|jgi:Zn-dependent M28 family amino/carboxypeptidase|uniref:M28 family peptidase n=1 Tax=Limnovirga soli TaxID=2656915 RepID=A0A8J8FLV3_9BACT|nr:M28 family peptidase [Limnovirga soli]NNV57234.1 M28 family peptidase [Limnovirga soli]
MRRIILACAMLATTASFAQSVKKIQKLASSIKATELKEKLSIIASAEMEGRETATAGQKKAAAYIENYFKTLGLQPGTADGYQMQFPVYQDSLASAVVSINGKALAMNTDFSLSANSLGNGTWTEDSVVFASFGIVDSLKNDFKSLSLKNKWVVIAEGRAEDATKAASEVSYNFRSPASPFMKMMQARANGAKGVIIIAKDFPRNSTGGIKGNMYLKQGNKSTPVVYISYSAAASLLGKSLSAFGDIASISTGSYATNFSYTCNTVTNTLQSSNVIGVLPGTDKKEEYVFITGHYDHLGKKGDVIYYGADDDGSGTTSVIELAEAFTAAAKKGYQPRRSIVFMTVSGEEKGLWGSEYYAAHPIFPLDKTVVDLNIDMVGRIDPDRKYGDSTNYVYTIGEDKLSSDLLVISDSINKTYTHMELDRKYNDPKDPNRFYYRSDHYNFAKNGVPVIFYFNGTHADYHQPTDTVDKINFDVMTKRVKLVFYTAWEMVNRNDMIKRDIPLK